jgi:peptidoglycan/LPS O-acetylase OafA/YrhL
VNTSILELETKPDSRRSEAAQPPIAPQPPATRRPPLPALTGIRTLLAFAIILFHFTPPHLGILYPFIDNGYVFVGVFFLISGYILTYNYADRAKTLVKREFWLAADARR